MDRQISDLPQASSIGDDDLFVLEQNDEAKSVPGETVLDYVKPFQIFYNRWTESADKTHAEIMLAASSHRAVQLFVTPDPEDLRDTDVYRLDVIPIDDTGDIRFTRLRIDDGVAFSDFATVSADDEWAFSTRAGMGNVIFYRADSERPAASAELEKIFAVKLNPVTSGDYDYNYVYQCRKGADAEGHVVYTWERVYTQYKIDTYNTDDHPIFFDGDGYIDIHPAVQRRDSHGDLVKSSLGVVRTNPGIKSYMLDDGSMSPIYMTPDQVDLYATYPSPDEWQRNAFVGAQTLKDYVTARAVLKPVVETFSIQSANWGASAGSPFGFTCMRQAAHTIGADTVVELINNNAVAFAKFGIAIISVANQWITFGAITKPDTAVTLEVNYYG